MNVLAKLRKRFNEIKLAASENDTAFLEQESDEFGGRSFFFKYVEEVRRGNPSSEVLREVEDMVVQARSLCAAEGDLICQAAYRNIVGRCNQKLGLFTLYVYPIDKPGDRDFLYPRKFHITSPKAWDVLKCFLADDTPEDYTHLGDDFVKRAVFKGSTDLQDLGYHIEPMNIGRSMDKGWYRLTSICLKG